MPAKKSTVTFTDEPSLLSQIVSAKIWRADGQTVRMNGDAPSVVLVCRDAQNKILGHVSILLSPLCVIEPGGFFAIPGKVAYGPQLEI